MNGFLWRKLVFRTIFFENCCSLGFFSLVRDLLNNMKFLVGQRVLAKSLNFLHRFGLTTSGRFPMPMDLFYTLERISKTLIFSVRRFLFCLGKCLCCFFPFSGNLFRECFPELWHFRDSTDAGL